MGYVYILQSGDDKLFKIGRTEHDIELRIKQLSTGNPQPLTRFDVIETDYASKCETFLHNRLQAKRSRRSEANEFFELEPDELAQHIRDARDYVENDLPKLAQVELLAEAECEDRWVSPCDADTAIFQRLLEVRAAHETLAHEKERLETELKLIIGTAEGLEGLASWKAVEGHRFDGEAFKTDQPELYEQYSKPTRVRQLRLL